MLGAEYPMLFSFHARQQAIDVLVCKSQVSIFETDQRPYDTRTMSEGIVEGREGVNAVKTSVVYLIFGQKDIHVLLQHGFEWKYIHRQLLSWQQRWYYGNGLKLEDPF